MDMEAMASRISSLTKQLLEVLRANKDKHDAQDAIMSLSGLIGNIIGEYNERQHNELLGLANFSIVTSLLLADGFNVDREPTKETVNAQESAN